MKRPPRERAKRLARRAVDKGLAKAGYALIHYDASFTHAPVDRTVPLPPEAEELRPDNPRLRELRAQYDRLGWPVCRHSRWDTTWLDFQYFRGDSSYVWHYRENRRTSELLFFVYLEEVLGRDHNGLVEKLGEDGAFGCWAYDFAGRPRCSRDLLDAVNELLFLDRHLSVLGHEGLRVVDIGAGYGRLAHRFAQAAPGLADYCCLDAVPTSTFLCEWYTRYRGVTPPVRVVPLPEVPDLAATAFDLACNVHCWSECTVDAIAWWAGQLARLQVPRLFVVPNEPEGFLSTEVDGTRRDYLRVLEAAGYRLVVDEPVIADPAARAVLDVHDRHCLFEAG